MLMRDWLIIIIGLFVVSGFRICGGRRRSDYCDPFDDDDGSQMTVIDWAALVVMMGVILGMVLVFFGVLSQ